MSGRADTALRRRAPMRGALMRLLPSLVLLLPCFAGVVQHPRAPMGALTAQHSGRARGARVGPARAEVVSSIRLEQAAASTMPEAEASIGSDADWSDWRRGPNPFELVRPDIEPLTASIKQLLRTDHPVLNMAAQHFFDRQTGKQFRPTIVLLMSRAVGLAAGASDVSLQPALAHVPGVQGDLQDSHLSPAEAETPYGKQYRLAEITEVIHTASLIHDDVLDEADTRRGGAAVHKAYSNTVAVLAGDYLLARASLMMARLRNIHVVQTMALSLEALVQGEIMQIKATPEERMKMSLYIQKSFFKTASLIAYSSKSAALLGGHAFDSPVTQAAYDYGYHLGLAFQIVDDMLDFTGSADALGKPKLQDMALGLATAPILYAAQEYPVRNQKTETIHTHTQIKH